MTDTGALGGRVVGIVTTRDHEHVVRDNSPCSFLFATTSGPLVPPETPLDSLCAQPIKCCAEMRRAQR